MFKCRVHWDCEVRTVDGDGGCLPSSGFREALEARLLGTSVCSKTHKGCRTNGGSRGAPVTSIHDWGLKSTLSVVTPGIQIYRETLDGQNTENNTVTD